MREKDGKCHRGEFFTHALLNSIEINSLYFVLRFNGVPKLASFTKPLRIVKDSVTLRGR